MQARGKGEVDIGVRVDRDAGVAQMVVKYLDEEMQSSTYLT